MIVDRDLNIQQLGDRISLFSPSPDRNSIITVDQKERINLLDGEMHWQAELHP
jgi:hypothetical protein